MSGETSEPGNMGRMNDPDGSAWVTGLCGDTMEMYLVIENGTVTDATFFTDGCGSSRACGAAAVALAKGKTVEEVLRISPADVADVAGVTSGNDIHCAILPVSTLHRALADYLVRSGRG
ncbi:MAG: iron-sulfur cluster assembly scaffold protein [Chitinispirillaceae bacterium]|nr:iron-sulfur cluster assembly scaffold protein [Chitinispirillaceae bacterium]